MVMFDGLRLRSNGPTFKWHQKKENKKLISRASGAGYFKERRRRPQKGFAGTPVRGRVLMQTRVVLTTTEDDDNVVA
ncbi:hypothetical protein PV325_005052 [Microctonus aethiopoides]|nr:hypothetical protein PV325_005052 [Microctonus aethiopoides]